MAELGTAAIGVGAALGATAYAAATGFIARHESVHSLQVTEIRRHISDFEAAYGRGEVTEEDWGKYLSIRTEARQKESEYEECISAYKDTPTFRFVAKWKKKRQVRRKKAALQTANRSLRLHYYESTSDASDTSSVTAVSGSPPRSRKAHSDEDDKRILSWAEEVANSESDSDGLHAGRSSTALRDILLSKEETTRRQRIEAEKRLYDEFFKHIDLRHGAGLAEKRRYHELFKHLDLRAAYRNLKNALPDAGNQEATRPTLLDRATQHIVDLEERNKELRARIVKEEAEIERLNRLQGEGKDGFPPGMLDVPVSLRS